jgi:hypothetical protein
VRRLLVRHRIADTGDARAQGNHLLLQERNRSLLFEDDLVQLGELLLEVGVADFQVDDARVHGSATSSTDAGYS